MGINFRSLPPAVAAAALALFVAAFAGAAASQAKSAPLSKAHKAWLEDEVAHIITPRERDVFQRLETDQDRDAFMEEFWRQRDPTPGTARNEFRLEHEQRLAAADKAFGREVPGKGRRTERGRIYVMLGPPISVASYNEPELYPAEIWTYRGIPALGTPAYFRLLFFRPAGGGDYRLFNPAMDGPKDLVHNPDQSPQMSAGLPIPDIKGWDERDKQAFAILQSDVSLELAESTISLYPGSRNPNATLTSSILLAEINRAPQKRVDDRYAVNFLEHKPSVEVNYSVRFVGNRTAVAVLEDQPGLFFLNYVIVPETISIDRFEDKFIVDLKTTVRLADAAGRTLYQEERYIPVEMRKDELSAVEKSSFQLYDAVPVIPGTWTLSLLLENTVSKEFTTVERSVTVPDPKNAAMSPLILARKAFRAEAGSMVSRAYQVGGLQIYPSVNNVFPEKEPVQVFLQLSALPRDLREGGTLAFVLARGGERIWSAERKLGEYKDVRAILEALPPERLAAGTYELRAGLKDPGGREIQAAETRFEVRKEAQPGIWVVAQANPPAGDPSYSYILGSQYLGAGDLERGLTELGRAYERKKDSQVYAVGYAKALLEKKDAAKALEILKPFADARGANFELYLTLGRAARTAGDLEAATAWLTKALSQRGNVVEALNALGDCWLERGNKEEALKAWKKSLEINPNQETIKRLVGEIR